MIPYLVTFITTNILALLGQYVLKNNKKLGIFILILSVIPIILLGGLRTVDIGWDTERYCVPLYNGLQGLSLKEAITFLNNRQTEFGFGFLIYLLLNIVNNINFILTVLIAIPTYSVLYFLYKNKDKVPIFFGLFLYETTLYPIAYSTLRQCVSIGIIFIACSKFLDKKYILAILLLLFSGLFHDSYYMAIALFAIIYVNDSKKIPQGTKRIINFIVLFAIIVSVCFYGSFLRYLWNIGVLSYKYYRYLGSRFESSGLALRIPLLLYKTFCIILCSIYYMSKNISLKEKKRNKKWFIMLLIDYVISFFSFKIVSACRSTYYILFPALYAFLPITFRIFKNDKFNKTIFYILLIFVFLAYFLSSLDFYDMYPYKGVLRSILKN